MHVVQPNSRPQAQFISTTAQIAVYGGAAGGGKTFGMVLCPVQGFGTPGFGGIIFRRLSTELMGAGSVWEAATTIYPHLGGRSRLNPMDWKFPSGATIQFSHLQHEKDVMSHHSKQYAFVGLEEGTQFTEYQFWMLVSRLRSTCGVTPHMRLTVNPHPDHFLRRMCDWWIDADGYYIPERSGVIRWFVRLSDGSLEWADTAKELEQRHPSKSALSFTFIGAKLTDNVDLMRKDPGYRAKLLNLPRVQQLQLLGGNWNVKADAGDYFQRGWFPIVDHVPGGVAMAVRAWDKAASSVSEQNPDPDWTRGVKVHLHRDKSITIGPVESLRAGPHEVMERMKTIATQDGRRVQVAIWQDPGQAGLVDVDSTTTHLLGYPVVSVRASRDKTAFASVWSPLAKIGRVRLLRGPWNESFLDELEAFPTGRHDDQVDAVSLAVQVITGGATEYAYETVVGSRHDPENQPADDEDGVGRLTGAL